MNDTFAIVDHQERRVALPARPTVRIAVIADTHSRPHARAAALLRALEPHVLLHAGDIGDVGVLAELAGIAPELHAVRGNIDSGAPLPDALTLSLSREGGGEILRMLLTHIAVSGPRLTREARALARRERADLVVCGHSHVPLIAKDGELTVFNPGSIGPRRFTLPIVFGVLELRGDTLVPWHVDCETGERWTPP